MLFGVVTFLHVLSPKFSSAGTCWEEAPGPPSPRQPRLLLMLPSVRDPHPPPAPPWPDAGATGLWLLRSSHSIRGHPCASSVASDSVSWLRGVTNTVPPLLLPRTHCDAHFCRTAKRRKSQQAAPRDRLPDVRPPPRPFPAALLLTVRAKNVCLLLRNALCLTIRVRECAS